jgi:saccharopine dehydrogenase (NAD+, L-glutamate forming)
MPESTAPSATATDTAARELDVLLLGATGFTGGLVARELSARAAGTRLRWGIAGRDTRALERVAAALPGDPTVIHADVTDPVSLDAMARRTRVLATTVGPYARLGVGVARACATNGTHYADITGEEGFVRTLEGEVDATARATGATMVVCCGFDSVPHDLGVRFAVERLPDEYDIVLRGYVRASGRMSGGTARTALETLSGATPVPPRVAIDDTGIRPVGRLALGTHRPRELGGWAVPMPTVDPLIVLRSARTLPGYGATFNYGHFAHLRRTATLVGAGTGLGLAALAARTRPGRTLLERLLPAPGEGPDESTRAAARFTVLLIGVAHGPREEDDVRIIARVRGGDPGYGETSRMLAEAALTLASEERPDVCGVVTPAIGLGAPYQRRLEASGMRFEIVQRTP